MTTTNCRQWARPLAQDYSVVFKCPEDHIRTDGPSLARLPSGTLMSTFVLVRRGVPLNGQTSPEMRVLCCTSGDGGTTWNQVGALEGIDDGLLFIRDDTAYLLCGRPGRNDILISRSDDEGRTWADPVVLFEGRFWNTPTGCAVRNNTLYWSYGVSSPDGLFNRTESRLTVVAGDLSRDLLDPAAWRMPPFLTYPGTPEGLSCNLFPSPLPHAADHWLEPNVVNVNGRIRVFVRVRIDGQGTANICAICDVDDDGKTLDWRFTQFSAMPGAQCKFHIIPDEQTGYFWTPVNIPTQSQNAEHGAKMVAQGFLGTPGNERRFLMLQYSMDALNWFHAGCIAGWPSSVQGFQYASIIIDGDDLLVTSRTSKDRENQHDNDLVTFHRVADFRSLALDLHQRDRQSDGSPG